MNKEESLVALQNIETTCRSMGQTLDKVSALTSDFSTMYQASLELKRQIAVMDHQLDAFIVEKRSNLEKFRLAVSTIEKQLTRISDRMDHITDKVLECDFGDTDTSAMNKRESLIEMLNTQNDSFNNMIIKLLSI